MKGLNKEKSIKEMKESASRFRSLQTIRRTFCKVTNTKWEEATERFSSFTDEERLLQFSSLTFSKDVPQPFLSYCQAAVRSDHEEQCSQGADSFQLQGCRGYVLQHDILTLSYTVILAEKIPYNGAHLFLANVPEVCLTSRILTSVIIIPQHAEHDVRGCAKADIH